MTAYCALRLRACVVLCLVSIGLLLPSTTAAQTSQDLEVVVSAEIPERCGFETTSASLNAAADLEHAGAETVRLGLDCNAPYWITAHAVNGRLVRQDGADDGSGFAFAKTYGVTVVLDTDRGSVRSERCLSESLVEGRQLCALAQPSGLTSGSGVSIGRDAELIIDWPSQAEADRRLAAGAYSDTIIIEIGART